MRYTRDILREAMLARGWEPTPRVLHEQHGDTTYRSAMDWLNGKRLPSPSSYPRLLAMFPELSPDDLNRPVPRPVLWREQEQRLEQQLRRLRGDDEGGALDE